MRYEPYIFKETIFSLGNVKNTVHEISYPWLSLMTSRLRRWKHKTSTPPFKCDKVGSMGASVVFLFNPKDNRPSSLASRILYIAPSIGVPTSWSLLPATSSFIPHPDLKRMRDNLSIIDLTHSLLVNLELSCNSISSFPHQVLLKRMLLCIIFIIGIDLHRRSPDLRMEYFLSIVY